jgi:NitT/TauT family transport system permease protein
MFIGTRYGLGRRIYEAQLLFRIPELYATTFVAGLSGYLLNKLVVLTERRALHWVGQ